MSWLITIDGDAVNLATESLCIERFEGQREYRRIVARPSGIVVAADIRIIEAQAFIGYAITNPENRAVYSAERILEKIRE